MRYIVALLVASLLGTAIAQSEAGGVERDLFDPAKRVVFTKEHLEAEAAAEKRPVPFDGAWTPSEKDLAALEADLLPLLLAEIERDVQPADKPLHARDYYRQYMGLISGGRRLIVTNGLHARNLELVMQNQPDREIWKRQIVQTALLDGCRSFMAAYDVDARAFAGAFRCPKNAWAPDKKK